jgi:hypothetical protein
MGKSCQIPVRIEKSHKKAKKDKKRLTRLLYITIIALIAVSGEAPMVSRKDISLLRTRYYRLSGEHRALVIEQAEELAIREMTPPGQEGQETARPERGVATEGKPGGAG